MAARRKSDQEVFDTYVNKLDGDDGCWEWTGHIEPDGYGLVRREGKNLRAHRFVFMMFKGEISQGLQLDHLCRNRRCVNPSHLEPVTHRENQMRGETIIAANASKTHCPRGHELIEGNLVVTALKKGMRTCKRCATDRAVISNRKRKLRDPQRESEIRRAAYQAKKAKSASG